MSDAKTTAADDALSKAAAGAEETVEEIEDDSVQADPVPELEQSASPEPPEDEKDEDGLPVDHKARSDLGRKLSAFHRRQDTFEQKIDKLIDVLSASAKAKPEETEFDDDMPMTKAEAREYFKKVAREESIAKEREKEQHDSDYNETLYLLVSEYNDVETEGILGELQAMRYNPSSDGKIDAERNFLKAERAYLRKQLAKPKKDVPLKKDTPSGVLTNQTVPKKGATPPKLNAAGKSYLDFVTTRDGGERAQTLVGKL